MSAYLIKKIAEENRSGKQAGLYSVCSANELVLRAALRDAARKRYPLIIESTANQVNQFGGYTGILPSQFFSWVKKIAAEESMPEENLILGGDHLGPVLWQNENENSAMEKAAELVKAYTLAGFTKIHLDTSMKLADDPPGALDPRICARRGALLARVVYSSLDKMPNQAARPVLVIGSEVPIPGGQKSAGLTENDENILPTKAEDFLEQVEIFKNEFKKQGLDFGDVAAFVVQPGVEFGDDSVFYYDPEKAKALCGALKKVPGLVFEGHSTDYQTPGKLAELVRDGIAILKVGPGLTFALREGLFLLEAAEETLVPETRRSNLKKTLLRVMDEDKSYWEKYYSGTAEQIEFKKLYSYSDRCRYYLPVVNVQTAINRLFSNVPHVPPALLSQFFPAQYKRFAAGLLSNDPVSIICDRIGETCTVYAAACGYGGRSS